MPRKGNSTETESGLLAAWGWGVTATGQQGSQWDDADVLNWTVINAQPGKFTKKQGITYTF